MSVSIFLIISPASPSHLVAFTWMSGCSSFHFATVSSTLIMPSPSGRRCRYSISTASPVVSSAAAPDSWVSFSSAALSAPEQPARPNAATVSAAVATSRFFLFIVRIYLTT